MATRHDIIGEEWAARAGELADWAMQRLVNRRDIWGQYSVLTPAERKKTGRDYKAMTLPQVSMRDGSDHVTIDKLTRHFASRHLRKPQIIGLHAKSTSNTSRWLGIDIDMHDLEKPTAEDHARRNLSGALHWVEQLQDMGYDPLLFDSSGAGGLHLWVLFAEPAPTEDVFALAHSLVSEWEARNLDEEPETFPKKLKPRSMGAWFRLPGLHPSREHYACLWSGEDTLDDQWLYGHAVIDRMLSTVPGPPPPAADVDVSYAPRQTIRTTQGSTKRSPPKPAPTTTPKRKAATRKRQFERSGKATICVDLDGVLHRHEGGGLTALGDPIDGAVDFTRELSDWADVVVLTSRMARANSKERKAFKEALGAWLDEHGFAWTSIHDGHGKPAAQAYIDDRGVACRPQEDGVKAFSSAAKAARELAG